MLYNSEISWLESQIEATQKLLDQMSDSYLMKVSLENRINELKSQLELAADEKDILEAKLDIWFSGDAVYGSQGISTSFMEKTMHSLVGMIQSSTRQKVNAHNAKMKLQKKKQNARMPKGKFFVTGLTHGSFGYEMAFKDNEQGCFFDDQNTALSIHEVMKIIEDTSQETLDIETLIDSQPLKLLSHLKDFLTTVNKQRSIVRMRSGDTELSLDVPQVNLGYRNICNSDISQKEEVISAKFQGAFIKSGKFEYTDEEGKTKHGDISDELSEEEIADMNTRFSNRDCKMNIIKNLISYSNGNKREMIELVSLDEL